MKTLNQPITLKEVVDAMGGTLHGDPLASIDHLASIEHAQQCSLTFIANPKYVAMLERTLASVVILRAEYLGAYKESAKKGAIVTADPYLYYAKLTQWWKTLLQAKPKPYIDASATVHPDAQVSSSVTIEAGAVIAQGAVLDAGVFIGAQSYIGENVHIGENSHIGPQVSILHDCQLGKHARIFSGAVIGADGFGHARNSDGSWERIEQFGAVIIGDDVEVGANTCIDRGAIDDTIIADGVKLDNLNQIGHNVHIGDHTIIASRAGISGSTLIGKRCTLAGDVKTAGHIEIADDVVILGATNVSKSITKTGYYSGIIPFDEASAWRKNAVLLKNLSGMRDRIRELEKQVSYLTSTHKDGKSHD